MSSMDAPKQPGLDEKGAQLVLNWAMTGRPLLLSFGEYCGSGASAKYVCCVFQSDVVVHYCRPFKSERSCNR